MKKSLFVFIAVLLFQSQIFAQITEIFYAPVLIDNQTTTSPTKKQKIFQLHHRFSKIEEISDLYGIYGASNVRVGLDYGITDKLMIGFGTEKYSKMQELRYKYAILQQTEGKIPVSLSYFGNIVVQGGKKDLFGADYKFTNRMSYFNQLIIARQITSGIALQIAPSFSHFNKVDSIYENDAVGINVGGKVKIHNDISFIFEFNQGFWTKDMRYFQNEAKPGFAFGVELGTGTHAFEIFASTLDQITPQKIYNFNQNAVSDSDNKLGGFMFGFNLTARM